jgi:NAD(P)-dependent dehydrogenase (short-subunit alcohol dehydrogenase family)
MPGLVEGKVALITGAAPEQGRAEAVRAAQEGVDIIAGDPRLGGVSTNLLPIEGTAPQHVADTVLFLASDESKYVTAHEIALDAGVTEF